MAKKQCDQLTKKWFSMASTLMTKTGETIIFQIWLLCQCDLYIERPALY